MPKLNNLAMPFSVYHFYQIKVANLLHRILFSEK